MRFGEVVDVAGGVGRLNFKDSNLWIEHQEETVKGLRHRCGLKQFIRLTIEPELRVTASCGRIRRGQETKGLTIEPIFVVGSVHQLTVQSSTLIHPAVPSQST